MKLILRIARVHLNALLTLCYSSGFDGKFNIDSHRWFPPWAANLSVKIWINGICDVTLFRGHSCDIKLLIEYMGTKIFFHIYIYAASGIPSKLVLFECRSPAVKKKSPNVLVKSLQLLSLSVCVQGASLVTVYIETLDFFLEKNKSLHSIECCGSYKD